jgi:LAO/AO transport system kinase
VIVETVGIGQSEGDLKQAVDTVVLCIQPGSGDSLQFMKAGIMELPDIVAVTKADMGVLARRAASDVAGALSLSDTDSTAGWKVPVCEVSAQTLSGVDDLVDHWTRHHAHIASGEALQRQRKAQHVAWFKDMVRAEFGHAGLKLAAGVEQDWLTLAETAPFASFHGFAARLRPLLGL